jgi:hypothetical protein
MKKGLILLVVMSLLLISCVRIGSAAPAGKAPGKVPDVTGGMAQTPGELQSLPGAQPGSAPISQSGSSGRQPSASGSGMGELQGLQGGNQPSGMGELQGLQGGQPGSSGSLPVIQGSGQSGSLGGFIQPSGPGNLPAGVPVSPNMAGFKDGSEASQQDNTGSKPWKTYPDSVAFVTDKSAINPGEAALLWCQVEGAASITITDSEGRKFDVPVRKRGLFVVPTKTTTYTMVASNSAGSITESVTVIVTFEDIGEYYDGKLRSELTTFWFSRSTIKRGESTWLFWNTRNAEDVFIWDQLIGTDYQKERTDERFRARSWGEREIYPPQNVSFYVTYGYHNNFWWAGGTGVSVDP